MEATVMTEMRPQARVGAALQVSEIGDELIVYDLERFRAHRLNRTAALVWRACDGTRSTAELAEVLSAHGPTIVSEDVIWSALNQLRTARLLEGSPALQRAPTRRELLASAGAAALVVLPVVASIVVPTPAAAQSLLSSGSSSSFSEGS
jgi:hypothetical protein